MSYCNPTSLQCVYDKENLAQWYNQINIFSYVDELLYWSGRRMRLEEFLRGELTGDRLPPTWVSAHQLVYQADDGGLLALDTLNNTLTVLVTNHTLVSHIQLRRTVLAHAVIH